jgi:hypothetical protein
MKKPQRHLYVVSPGGLGCTAFFGSYEIDHFKEAPEYVEATDAAVETSRKGKNPRWIVSAIRLPKAAVRAIRQRLQRRLSGAAA